MITNSDNTVSFIADVNSKYICADNYGNNPLIANRDTNNGWEKFDLIKNSDGTVSLKAIANGKFVTAENYGTEALIARATVADTWEKFQLIYL